MNGATAARRGLAALLGAALLCSAGAGRGQSSLEFDIWMQKIDQRSQSVLRHLARGDEYASRRDAEEIARLYKLMEDFYERWGNADDAVLASYVGKELAGDIVKALARHDFAAAARAAGDIAADCRNCHVKYKPM